MSIIIGLVLFCSSGNLNAMELKDQWIIQYGSSQNDRLSSIILTSDGGYLAVGTTSGDVGQTTSFGSDDGWIIKVASNGSLEWSKQYGGPQSESFYSVEQTSDGGYIVAGFTTGSVDGNTPFGGYDGWLLKVSSNGSTEWSKQYGTNQFDTLDSVQIASDGGYIATGTTAGSLGSNTNKGGFDGYVLKVATDGSEQWVKQYGTTVNDNLKSIQATNDGGYIVAGYTSGVLAGGSNLGRIDGWLLKINSSGVEEWSKQYGTTGEDLLDEVRQTNDGGYIAVGYFDNTYGSLDGWIVKTDSNGVQEWSKWYGTSTYEYLSSIELTKDGGYIVVGESYVSPDYDGWLLKITADGTADWSRFYGTDKNDYLNSVKQTPDGGYVVAGSTFGSLAGNTSLGLEDGLLVKLSETYDLSFDLNGGTGTTPEIQWLEKGTLATKPENPLKDGFAFDGWNTAADGSGTSWDFTSTAMPENSVTLYAQWKAVYQLQFDLNGGDGIVPAVQILTEGSVAQAVDQPTREGYTFKGWNTAADGSGTSWDIVLTTMPANDVILYAQWEEKKVDPVIPPTSKPENGDNGKLSVYGLPKTGGYTIVLISLLMIGAGSLVSRRFFIKK